MSASLMAWPRSPSPRFSLPTIFAGAEAWNSWPFSLNSAEWFKAVIVLRLSASAIIWPMGKGWKRSDATRTAKGAPKIGFGSL